MRPYPASGQLPLAGQGRVTDNARAWLEGRPCGFFEFKRDDELIPLWEKYGDPKVATWDLVRDSKPVPLQTNNPCTELITKRLSRRSVERRVRMG